MTSVPVSRNSIRTTTQPSTKAPRSTRNVFNGAPLQVADHRQRTKNEGRHNQEDNVNPENETGFPMKICHFIVAALAALLATPSLADASEPRSADIIVYGSTPGGFCAAIAAAREGASVILLEPTDHVGGMSTGGLSHCDSNQMARSTLMGLFDEWHTRVVRDYTDRGLEAPYDPAEKDQSRWTFEPHVAMRVTMKMLDEAGVKVLTERDLQSVTQVGPRIASLVTK